MKIKDISMGVVIILLLSLLMYIGYDMIKEEEQRLKDIQECLKPIAKEFCENNSMIFFESKVLSTRFYCFKTERAPKGDQFLFSLEEINKCKEFVLEVDSE